MLPCHPLFGSRLVERVGEAELVLGVIVARQVGEDRKTLHDSKATLIVVYDDRNAAIRTELSEPLLLLNVLPDVDALKCVVLAVCFLQLLEDD